MKKILSIALFVLGFFVIGIYSQVLAQTWTPPACDPPGCFNFGGPLYSSGASNQTLAGTLQIQGTGNSKGGFDLILNTIQAPDTGPATSFIKLQGGGIQIDNSAYNKKGYSALDINGSVPSGNTTLGYLVGINNTDNQNSATGQALVVKSNGQAVHAESTGDTAVYGLISSQTNSPSSIAIRGENMTGGWAGYFKGGYTGVLGQLLVLSSPDTSFLGNKNNTILDGDVVANRFCILDNKGAVNCASDWGSVGNGNNGAKLPPGTTSQTMYYNGTDWVANSFLTNNTHAIGINTTPPTNFQLQVKGTPLSGGDVANASYRGAVMIDGSVNDGSSGNSELYLTDDGSGDHWVLSNDSRGHDPHPALNIWNGQLFKGNTTWSNPLTILSNGNIGIGNPNPTTKLAVAGDVAATGKIMAGAYSAWLPFSNSGDILANRLCFPKTDDTANNNPIAGGCVNISDLSSGNSADVWSETVVSGQPNLLKPLNIGDTVEVTSGVLKGGPNHDLGISAQGAHQLYIDGPQDVQIHVNSDGNGVIGSNKFQVNNGANSPVFKVDENGTATVGGSIQSTNGNVVIQLGP